METYNVLFYAKKVKNNPKNSIIYLRITISGKRTEISTGQMITAGCSFVRFAVSRSVSLI